VPRLDGTGAGWAAVPALRSTVRRYLSRDASAMAEWPLPPHSGRYACWSWTAQADPFRSLEIARHAFWSFGAAAG
jgi:hypothetical protein